MTKSFKTFSKKLNKTRKLYNDLTKEFDGMSKHSKEVINALEYYGENPKKNKDKIISEQLEYLNNLKAMKKEFKQFFHFDCDGFEHELKELSEDFVEEYNSAVRSRKALVENAKKSKK